MTKKSLGLIFLILVFLPVLSQANPLPHIRISNVKCTDCHVLHSADQEAFKPSGTAQETMCKTCHNPSGQASSLYNVANHVVNGGSTIVDCGYCHEIHSRTTKTNPHTGLTAVNLKIIRDNTNKHVPGANTPAMFQESPSNFAFFSPAPDGKYYGICQSCHTLTDHFRKDGTGPDQNHSGIGLAEGSDCTLCHKHENGFVHGAGAGSANCYECHGHDAGTNYDPDMTAPYTAGSTPSLGKGTVQSHSTHTETTGDDLRGPGIYCDTCHDLNNMPNFKNIDGSGNHTLAETDICNNCHSPGGTYDGVNDATFGVKANWENGIYETSSTLKSGKEKWCATCHDEIPANSKKDDSGIDAPNIAGDEDGSYTYGSGWGYYKTGHGLTAGENYPSKGGVETLAGRPVECNSCHDISTAHIDHNARTYNDNDSSTTDPGVYRQAYRLKQVNTGQGTGASTREPLLVPWPSNTSNVINNARLCFNCHASGPFLNSADMNTNMVTGGVNRHQSHLVINSIQYPADWSGGNNSLITCVNCHNVHGSTRLAMVRDGKLTGREPGLRIWYKNASITNNIGTTNPPDPEDIPLSASDGTAWLNNTATNLCTGCHNSGQLEGKDRIPYQNTDQAPSLVWTGESGYVTDGAVPDSGFSGNTFTFRVKYIDTNNDAPSSIQLWIDENDNGSYDPSEKYDMSATDSGDVNYMNGKIYAKALILNSGGDNIIKYCFYASDGTSNATGYPTGDNSVAILNNAPVLAWTGEAYFASDGVNPNTGGNNTSFEFRVDYIDADNQAPSSIQLWIDENDNGSYEVGEKYDMTAVSSGDTTYTDGKLYNKILTLSYVSDGNLNYLFYASDGTDTASGSPASSNIVTVASSGNGPPVLEWSPTTCRSEGVKPSSGANGADFEFFVKYTDPDNQCPLAASDIQVWVDIDDSGTYESGEKYNLSEDDAGDTTCSNGKIYKKSMTLSLAGDNTLNYRFYASDETDTASGDPVTDSTLTIIDAYKVRTAGGSGWYSTIQSGIDAAISGNKMVLVYEGVYNENLSLWNTNYSNTTVRAVCGADVTTISNPGNVVFLQNVSGVIIDGFEITGGTTGINSNGGSATIQNCKIHDNVNGAGRGAGLNAGNASSILTVIDSEIYSNSATEGAAATLNAGFGHSFTRTTIRNNTATSGNGGAVFTQNGSVGFTDVTLKDNTAATTGGAVYSNGSDTTFTRCTITGNVASGGTGGVLNNSNSGCDAVFINCIAADNHGTQAGVTYINQGTLTVTNSTFVYNQATAGNGGVVYQNGGTSIIRNSILWGNTATGSGYITYFNGGAMSVTDSVIASGDDGIYDNEPYFSGNVNPVISGYTSDVYPDFMDAANGNYHISSSSNAVDNANATYAPDTDIDGNARPQGLGDDIGADEYFAGTSAPVLSWTGETNYTADGVNPDSGVSGTSFIFHVDYTDADNNAPVLIQIWVDEDGNGSYSASEKYDMTETDSGDTLYTDGKRYAKSLTLTIAGGGTRNYRFYASDSIYDATGIPTANKTVTINNNVPALSWTGEANYVSDGIDPNNAIGGTSFSFRMDYTDADNTAPTSIQVWVDENDNGSYEAGEKYDMTGTDPGDTTFNDGKRYTTSLNLLYAGDGTLNYRFYASDGASSATGAPTANGTVSITNNAPSLSWTGETNFAGDGVNPDSGSGGSSFEFRIDYTDVDNTPPSAIQVWVDENDNGIYDTGEKYDMTETDGGDTTCNNGKRYSKPLTLDYVNDGIYSYRFYASDGTDVATGTPVSDSAVTVTFSANNAPVLAWTSETNYTTDGVNPDSGPDSSSFTFRVKYTDDDNDAPSSIQIWIDENDNAVYDTGEKYNMTQVDAGDTVYSDGKLYTINRTIAYAGDGTLTYRFFANDGTADATGTPVTSGGTITVINPITVCASGCDFTSIQGAISDAGTTSGKFIKVSGGPYSENVNFSGKNVTVYSAGGPASILIDADGDDLPVITFNSGESTEAVLDGFIINHKTDGGNNRRGIAISNNSSPTIKNCLIRGNEPATYVDGNSIYIDGAGVDLQNTTIGGVSGTPDTGDLGTGIYATGSSTKSISATNCTFSYNSGSTGGAVYLINRTTMTTITDCTISNNSVSLHGAGIYCSSSPLTIANTSITNNTSTQDGAGICLTGSSSTLTITGTTSISNNTGRVGTGINANGIGTVSISDTTIGNNIGSSSGAGMSLTSMAGNVSMTSTNITSNTGTTNGAGIYFSSAAAISFALTNCNVNNNTVTNTGSYDGGGLFLSSDTVTATITGGSISGNTGRNGGGIYATGGINSFSITGVVIENNNAATGAGGGLYIVGNSGASDTNYVSIGKSFIRGNRAKTYGGGIYTGGWGDTTLTNSMVTGNLATGVSYNDGGGINNSGTTKVYFSTVAGNYTSRNGGGYSGGGTITNCIFWGNTAGGSNNQINGSPTVTYTDVSGGFTGTGNIDLDPAFADFQASTSTTPTITGNFRICNGSNNPVSGCTSESGVIDVGSTSNTPSDDIDGQGRPYDVVGKGDEVNDYDMGADEYRP